MKSVLITIILVGSYIIYRDRPKPVIEELILKHPCNESEVLYGNSDFADNDAHHNGNLSIDKYWVKAGCNNAPLLKSDF